MYQYSANKQLNVMHVRVLAQYTQIIYGTHDRVSLQELETSSTELGTKSPRKKRGN